MAEPEGRNVNLKSECYCPLVAINGLVFYVNCSHFCKINGKLETFVTVFPPPQTSYLFKKMDWGKKRLTRCSCTSNHDIKQPWHLTGESSQQPKGRICFQVVPLRGYGLKLYNTFILKALSGSFFYKLDLYPSLSQYRPLPPKKTKLY